MPIGASYQRSYRPVNKNSAVAVYQLSYSLLDVMVGERIRERLGQLDVSQAELARRVGMSQPAINALIRGASRSSTHLHRIARELRTTPAYLAGEIDDPDVGALPPPPQPPLTIMMQVQLPSEAALAQMFEGLLAGIDRRKPQAEQALLLAQRLPIGLAQLRDLRPARPTDAQAPATADGDLATLDREPPR